jgi:diguanylate cyclase (GGDEF)-like protein
VLMRSEIRLRGEVVIDSLTGMLNRRALVHRVEELEQQSAFIQRPVGLIVADIDHFKQFNDGYGHAAGDALLTDLGYELRKTLRAFDLCYRTGGEEFLVLLPGADLAQASALAEQLRDAAAAVETAGRRVTMSFGVAAAPAGQPFDYEAVFAEADAALYEAKREGRDRVRTSRIANGPASSATGVRLVDA